MRRSVYVIRVVSNKRGFAMAQIDHDVIAAVQKFLRKIRQTGIPCL
jgi:hypothetical protein